jgi:hypothetical protein
MPVKHGYGCDCPGSFMPYVDGSIKPLLDGDWTAPDLMDTLLGGIRQFFVLSWAEIAQA